MNQKMKFVLEAQATDNFRELCREFDISPRVGYKWQKRFQEHGIAGLEPQSRRPKSNSKGLDEETVCRLVRLRERHPSWGPRKIQVLYRRSYGEPPSESSIKRILERCGMVKKRRIQVVKESGRLWTGTRAERINQVWTIDFKGWWHDREGRCEPLTIRDEYSRYILELRTLADARTESVKQCMERVFEKYGLPDAIRSDNGAPFASTSGLLGLSRLSVWWLALGISLERGRPGCPQDNGAHERMHLDISRQLERTGYQERQPALDLWRMEFNQERPHEALEMRFPAEVYEASKRKYLGTPEELSYPGVETRKVKARGSIHFDGVEYFLSTALKGWNVGIIPTENGLYKVDFAGLLLGQLEPSTEAFLPAVPQGKAGEEPQSEEQSAA